MKTNRRKYRTFSRHGDFLFTKREANKRNRKDVKKMLTNIAQYVIISISNEREVIIMRRLVYKLANGTIVKTLAEAQSSGQTYVSQMEEIKSERPKRSPIAQAMIDQFGYISPKLKDKIVGV